MVGCVVDLLVVERVPVVVVRGKADLAAVREWSP
jgi:hypothetical protein